MSRTVVVSGWGTFVGKRSERLVLRPGVAKARGPRTTSHIAAAIAPRPSPAADGNAAWGLADAIAAAEPPLPGPRPVEPEIPLFQVGEIILPARGVTVSVELLAEAAERGIAVSFLSSSGKPYALLSSPMLTATVGTRREQLRALDDERGAQVCKRIVSGKLRNQAGLLVYFAKGIAASDASRRRRIIENAAAVRRARQQAVRIRAKTADAAREVLMGIEGAAARAYWAGVAAICEGRARFEGRKREGDIGPVNAVLNYGYGILYSRVWAAALNAGLDPFAGFLHTDRPGKPSLVLDLVEELRAPVVDRAVLAYIGLGRAVRFDGKRLDDDTRRAIADAVLERLDAPVRYQGRSLRLSSVIQHQARSLATFLRGEGDWRGFTMYW